MNVFSNCDQLISSSHLTSSWGPNNHPLKCSNDFPLSATLAALNSLSLYNSHMLCTLGNTVRTIYHGKSSSKTNRVGIKKHQLWNNRIGGTSLPHCRSSSCYSLVFELLTLTEYLVTLTTKQHCYLFIYFMTWIGSERRTVNFHCSVKNMHLQNVTFSGTRKKQLIFILATFHFSVVPVDYEGALWAREVEDFFRPLTKHINPQLLLCHLLKGHSHVKELF